MVTKKARAWLLAAAGLVWSAAAGQAQPAAGKAKPEERLGALKPVVLKVEELGTAKPLIVEPFDAPSPGMVPVPAAGPVESAWTCCPRIHRFLEWLTYRPLTNPRRCGYQCCCHPPLYTFFLEYCPYEMGPAPSMRGTGPGLLANRPRLLGHRHGHCADGPGVPAVEVKTP